MKYLNNDIIRLLDANMNRASEGIRVLEETSRMIFDESDLTKKIKEIRHSLVHIIKEERKLDSMMLFYRDSERDTLREFETLSEKTRIDIISIVKANASRAQQAIRAMEEYIKLLFPQFSERFKKVRFALYDIEKTLVSLIQKYELVNKNRMGLCVVIDSELNMGEDIYEITNNIIDCGAGTIVYRDRISQDFDFMKNSERMLSACVDKEVTTIIEDRLDIAMIIHADGINVGYDDIPVKACRSVAGKAFVIGLSLPFDDDLSEKVDEDADYYIIGPIQKYFHDNIKVLNAFVSISHIPIVAFGTITDDNIKLILDSGVTGLMLETNYSNSAKIYNEIKKYRKIIELYK